MPRKDEFLSQLLSSKTQEIVSSPGKYTAFLPVSYTHLTLPTKLEV